MVSERPLAVAAPVAVAEAVAVLLALNEDVSADVSEAPNAFDRNAAPPPMVG
jgi:hypothetical protein